MAPVNIEILISEVMKHPALWNDRHKDFKNTNVKNEALERNRRYI